jgi:hypothetical protein
MERMLEIAQKAAGSVFGCLIERPSDFLDYPFLVARSTIFQNNRASKTCVS